MPEATVKWFDQKRRFGFATSAEGDVFLGADAAALSLWPGDHVLYDRGKGDRAANIILVDRAPRRHGFVRFWDDESGHGYVRCADQGSVYFNRRILEENGFSELAIGQHVEFAMDAGGVSIYRIALV